MAEMLERAAVRWQEKERELQGQLSEEQRRVSVAEQKLAVDIERLQRLENQVAELIDSTQSAKAKEAAAGEAEAARVAAEEEEAARIAAEEELKAQEAAAGEAEAARVAAESGAMVWLEPDKLVSPHDVADMATLLQASYARHLHPSRRRGERKWGSADVVGQHSGSVIDYQPSMIDYRAGLGSQSSRQDLEDGTANRRCVHGLSCLGWPLP
jgi:hypothetical protein